MTTAQHTFDEAVDRLRTKLTPQGLARVGAVYAFRFTDATAATLDASSAQGRGWVEQEPRRLGLSPDFEVSISREDFTRLVFGQLHPMAGTATGRMKLKGDFAKAIKLDRLMKS